MPRVNIKTTSKSVWGRIPEFRRLFSTFLITRSIPPSRTSCRTSGSNWAITNNPGIVNRTKSLKTHRKQLCYYYKGEKQPSDFCGLEQFLLLHFVHGSRNPSVTYTYKRPLICRSLRSPLEQINHQYFSFLSFRWSTNLCVSQTWLGKKRYSNLSTGSGLLWLPLQKKRLTLGTFFVTYHSKKDVAISTEKKMCKNVTTTNTL